MTSEHSDLRNGLTQAQAWTLFLECFLALVDPAHPEGIVTYAFISRTLAQFPHIRGQYDPAYVLHEVYLRSFDYIWTKDQRIRNLSPFIKRMALNIIHELSRKAQKTDSIEEVQDWEMSQVEDATLESEFDANQEFALITLAFQRLSEEEQRILRFVIVDKLPYRAIRAIYGADGLEMSEQNLRQKKTRALQRLRSIYHQLADQQNCCG